MLASLIAVLLAVCVCAGAVASPPSPDYKLVWSDEFDGTELDRAKWDYRQLGPRRKAINAKECVTLDGGNLVLTTKRVGDQVHTAMIGTEGKFEAAFGYFEVRVKLQTQVGHWSAFWLQSPTMTQVGDPKVNGTEIDIFEFLGNQRDTLHMNLHWDGYGKDHKHAGSTHKDPALAEGFHVIGLEWTPERYGFFLNGKEVWSTDKGISHRKEYLILSLEVDKWAGDITRATLPDSMLVDYVRVYQKPR